MNIPKNRQAHCDGCRKIVDIDRAHFEPQPNQEIKVYCRKCEKRFCR